MLSIGWIPILWLKLKRSKKFVHQFFPSTMLGSKMMWMMRVMRWSMMSYEQHPKNSPGIHCLGWESNLETSVWSHLQWDFCCCSFLKSSYFCGIWLSNPNFVWRFRASCHAMCTGSMWFSTRSPNNRQGPCPCSQSPQQQSRLEKCVPLQHGGMGNRKTWSVGIGFGTASIQGPLRQWGAIYNQV